MKMFKYALEGKSGLQQVVMPRKSRILSAAIQNGTICLWALVDESCTEQIARNIEIIGTGWPTECEYLGFIGTVTHNPHLQDQFVWHVFHRFNLDTPETKEK
jgi:hypothetical protein